MARFNGKQVKGAQRIMKEVRREEAEARNKLTLDENRKANRVTKNA